MHYRSIKPAEHLSSESGGDVSDNRMGMESSCTDAVQVAIISTPSMQPIELAAAPLHRPKYDMQKKKDIALTPSRTSATFGAPKLHDRNSDGN